MTSPVLHHCAEGENEVRDVGGNFFLPADRAGGGHDKLDGREPAGGEGFRAIKQAVGAARRG